MTAEEFLKEKYTVLYNKHPNNFKDKISLKSYLQSHIFGRINGVEQNNVEMMAEFAEYHVEQALKEVVDSINIYDYAENKDYSKFLDKNSILNAYPLTNIK